MMTSLKRCQAGQKDGKQKTEALACHGRPGDLDDIDKEQIKTGLNASPPPPVPFMSSVTGS
jgi:hypothetical protein